MRGLCALFARRNSLFARQLGSPGVLVAPPKQLVPALPFTLPHSVWLNTLKASARNSKYLASVIANFLNNPISVFQRLGLFNTLRCAVPNVKPCGSTKAAGL